MRSTPADPANPIDGTQTTTSTATSTAASADRSASPTTDASTAKSEASTVIAAAATTGATAASQSETQSPTTAAGSSPVADQVFPQVARLVSRGDGVHRLTLRLHPADLGEVKVVLTVKDNVVDVTMHADAAAREALRDGSPQLRSLLELAGAGAGQLVVRELTTTSSSATPLGTHQSGGQQSHGQRGHGSDSPGRDPGHTAPGRSEPATDLRPTRRTNRDSASHLDLDL
jgi:flagellar hook-length control protein FliK